MNHAGSRAASPGAPRRGPGTAATIRVGTSGYNYPEWRGSFYPDGFPASRMLGYYAERFATVEINYTFYRMPTPDVVSRWAAGVGSAFAFALKAPKRITHERRLRPDCADALKMFLDVASGLGGRQGPVLFQLPPNFAMDLDRLDAFLGLLPPRTRAAFEFRHPSWFDEAVYARLRRRDLALCVADSQALSTPVVLTARYAYFRLRDEGYTAKDLARWAATVRQAGAACREVFVYFKHEEAGKGPDFARRLMQALSPPTPASRRTAGAP